MYIYIYVLKLRSAFVMWVVWYEGYKNSAILPPCAQFLRCELYVMKDTKDRKHGDTSEASAPAPFRSALSLCSVSCMIRGKRNRNLSIPATAGSSPSMPHLVLWPLLALRRRPRFALRSACVVWVVWYEENETEISQYRRRPGLLPRCLIWSSGHC